MSLWNQVINKLKGILNKMIGKQTIQDVLRVTPAISNKMMQAIDLWALMYEDKAPWIKSATPKDPSVVRTLGLPQLIASEKARTALIEFESEITTPMKEIKPATPNYMNPDNIGTDGKPEPQVATHVVTQDVPKGSTKRAEYLNKQYTKIKDSLGEQLEYGIALGGLVIKPYVVERKTKVQSKKVDMLTGESESEGFETAYDMEFDYVQANEFFPLTFDANGKLTEAAFIQRKYDKDITYSRLEYHKLEGNKVTIVNKAYKSGVTNSGTNNNSAEYLGEEVTLKSVPGWEAFEPVTTIEDVDRLLFAYFKMPGANAIDRESPLGVSGFARATSLIEDADLQYSRLLWEFEGGELAIDIDREALRYIDNPNDPDGGHSVMSKLQQRLYRKVDLNDENTYNVFSPELRDQSLVHGLNVILMRIEDKVGLSRGTIADATMAEARTATELMLQRTRNYESNRRIQTATQKALDDAIYVMNALCDLYDITEEGEYEVSYEWDDSILVDKDTELTRRMVLMQNGLASKIETRMWYFGETEKQAREALIRIQQENLESVQQNIQEMTMLGRSPDSKKEESPKDNNNEEQEDNNNFKSGDNQYSVQNR